MALLAASSPLSIRPKTSGRRVETARRREAPSRAGRRLGTKQQQVWSGRKCGMEEDPPHDEAEALDAESGLESGVAPQGCLREPDTLSRRAESCSFPASLPQLESTETIPEAT